MDELDPELVLVFDLAGTVQDFRNAVNRVEGLEFLSEFLDEGTEPDDDFHMVSTQAGRTDQAVQHSLYLVMSNAEAANQLVRLFEHWQSNPTMTFAWGLTKFRTVFEQLRAIRRWSAADRVRDTGLIDAWREHVAVVGQSASSVLVEIELWYRRDAQTRTSAEAHISEIIRTAGGVVRDRAQIGQIDYHAFLIDLPVQQVETVLREGAESIELLTADEIMFVSPYTPMSVGAPTLDPPAARELPRGKGPEGLPRIALLDGLPFVNHDALAGRLTVDDPDGLGQNYALTSRHHGSAMASLIIHGDLSAPGEPLGRPLYVRPIMQPHEYISGRERVVSDKLFTDLLHRAIRRIVEGDAGNDAAAPSVRIINLSIGAASRALVRRMSPLGRLLDWLAIEYNLLFIVSAGNHPTPIVIPAAAATSLEAAKSAALKAARDSARLRGILPPGDALNALTVGATHDDAAGAVDLPDTVWDVTGPAEPALYGAIGPGVARSIKPDLHHSGGRAIYNRPILSGAETVELTLARTAAAGPGNQVAAPGRGGATDTTSFTYGTSNATALVAREASRVFDVLEQGADDPRDIPFPDPLVHPVLAKALLVHATSWGPHNDRLRNALSLDGQSARRELTAMLGYGVLDVERVGIAATNRAVLVTGGLIGREERHTFDIPLPMSLRAKAAWHRVTVTLAFMAPTVGQLSRYRGARVFFESIDRTITAGVPTQADHYAVRRGSCQHEIIEGNSAMVFGPADTLPVHVECMDGAQRQKANARVRYGLVVSIETRVQTSTTIHDEIRAQLRARVQERPRA